MLKDATTGRPIFQASALLILAEQLQSPTTARDYALTFLKVLPTRVDRILTATGDKDADNALDAVLSLKVNAHMVGALAIEEACNSIEQSLLQGDMPAAARNALTLPGNIAVLVTAMTDFLSRPLQEGTTPGNHSTEQASTISP
ncbi:Hpt domain-containing protein [Arthrobacter sp. efr-133-R2A-63]|uniref:Hpt domain-containing protein n=1 Tax=Arthrobacter sp. efr-133-R2A-63 TaxID=3040278 RepID=UPI00254A319D|nr:Hpt domain-containing protein [Arthrobacter sp. efr-133-R2A-63]